MPTERALRVVTFNLLNDLTYWAERGPLIAAGLRALEPDIVAVQEVALPFDSAAWLAAELGGGYSVLQAPYTGARAESEALALLSRLPVTDHARLTFEHQGRVAQKVRLTWRGRSWTVVNTHLHHSLYDDATRRREVARLAAWLPPGEPVVVCGDFNALPHYRAIRDMRARFVWAHGGTGELPSPTYPTPLRRGPGMRHHLRAASMRAIGLARHRRNEPWRGTLDYIFVDPSVAVLAAARALDAPAEDDATLWPSDHMALVADLEHPHPPRH